MNSFMIAFGLASIALCIGTLLRAKVPFLRSMLVPSSVIAGVLGMIFMNVAAAAGWKIGTDSAMYTEVVNHLFTISFISISLTGSSGRQDNTSKHIMKGAVGMGIIWCFLYALTPLIGAGVIALTGVDPRYGTLIPFAFTQGPGQAATFGALYESYGIEKAAMVAITFASIGFLVAFGVGIPAAKRGIAKGIARHCGEIEPSVLKGYFRKEEQTERMVKDTTYNGNIETLTYHFAVIGLCYILAVGIAKVFSLMPGFLGSSMSGMMYINGMFAAYLVKWAMKKLHIDFLLEDTLQSKITGWTADYLVVCAFMAVGFSIIKAWIVPMLIECVVITIVTVITCFYFGQRFGGSNDFERTLGLYGTCTGTVPSGIALVRIVDPGFHTTTSIELGLMNLVMMLSTPVYIVLLAMASSTLELGPTMGILAGLSVAYLILLKVTRCWGKKTYRWKGQDADAEVTAEAAE